MGAHPRSFSAEELLAHAGFLARMARDLTGDEHQAEDAVQNAWVAALERPPRSASALRAWLATVARTAVRNERRGEARRAEREERAGRPEADEPELGLERMELQRVLLDLVLALPAEQRVVLYLRYYEGLTPSAIAARIAAPVKTVKTRHTRALAELRARLDERSSGDRAQWVSALLPLVRPGALAGLLGGLAMKKLALGLSVFLVLVVLWQAPRWIGLEQGQQMGHGGEGAAPLAQAASDPAPAEPLAADPHAAQPERRPLAPPEPAPTTGALLVRLSWSDGAPAAGVAFSALCREDPAPREESFAAVTDATGSALVDGLFAGPAALDLDRGGRFHAEVAAGATTTVELAIPEGVDVEGSVVAPDGGPVAGAEVWVEGAHREWPAAKLLASTAADGSFRLRDLHKDARIGARAAGYRPSIFTFEVGLARGEDGVCTLTLELGEPGGRIHGRVLAPDGKPLAGALVQAGPRGGDFVESRSGASGLSPAPVPVATGPDGGFALPGDLEPGVQPIFAAARGHPIFEGAVEVVLDGTAFVEIRLEPPAAIEGRVLTLAGEPVEGAEVLAAREERGGWYHHAFPPPRAVTDADGRFALGWVAPGAREVNARVPERPRLGKAQRVVDCLSGATSTCELVLDPGRTISGRVVDASGRALEGWTVHAEPRSARFLHPRQDQTDAEGAFVLANLAEGTHELLVIAPGESRMTPRAREASVRTGSRDVVLVVERAGTAEGTFRGVFLDAQGRAPEDARLLVKPEGGMTFQYVEFDPGTGSFAGLVPVGRYRLVALRGNSSFGRSEPFDVVEGGDVDVGMFAVETPGRLEIALAGCPADELARLDFRLDRLDRPSEPLELVDGLLRSGDVAPGRWSAQVEGANLFLRGSEVEVSAGETTRVEIEAEPGFPVVLACRDPLPRWLELEVRAAGDPTARLLAGRSWLDAEGRARVVLPAGRATITVRTDDGRLTEVTVDVGPALLGAAPIPIEPR